MRGRVSGAILACALTAACNGLLGNSEHEIAADASTAGAADGAGSVGAADGSGSVGVLGSGDGGAGFDDPDAEGGGQADGCAGQGGCAPGAIQSCSTGGTQTCGPSCTWGACSSEPPSCALGGAGMNDCGSGGASCCTSLGAPAGTFDRSYDGVTFTDSSNPATLSAFRLDKYEATVGRFRQFVAAVVGGWLPSAGAGVHTHLNGGKGLNATGGGYEGGWNASWSSNLATTESGWNTNLAGGTWSATAGNSETLPISNVSWYEANAFCIWDEGFMPSEAEWNYAAAGGAEQRVYPWSIPPGSTALSCAEAWYDACSASGLPNAVGSESPAGDGKWGHADLAGNLFEWTLDWEVPYVNPCVDCVGLTSAPYTGKAMRGGSSLSKGSLAAAGRSQSVPANHYTDMGVRCARAP